MTLEHAARVRQLPGMSHARAYIVAESNIPYVVPTLYDEFRELGIGNAHLLHLDETVGRRRVRTADGNEAWRGDLAPGLWTSNENKGYGMELIGRYMLESRLHMHQNIVHYSSHNEVDEMQEAGTHDFDIQRIREAYNVGANVPAHGGGTMEHTVHSVLREASRLRIERLIYKEFGWMKRIVTRSKKRNGEDHISVRMTGKGGRDIDLGERRDDLVMGLVMVILGAAGFYTHPSCATERAALGLA